jgi:hypothetical protein
VALRGSRPLTGRASIFREKAGGDRVQGLLTPIGSKRFEQARATLAKLAGRETEQISDADTIEFLARGEANTRSYLAGVAN